MQAQKMRKNKGQAVIEYILLVVMLAVTVAIAIRGASETIYGFWTGLARQVASPCHSCSSDIAPDL